MLPEYIELLPVRDERTALCTLRYKGHFIHSPYDPLKEARDEVGRLGNISRYRLVIILGLGLGYLLQALLEKKDSRTMSIAGVEQERHFQGLQAGPPVPENVVRLFGQPEEAVMDRLSGMLEAVRLNEILFLENRPLSGIHKEYYEGLKDRILTRLRQQLADLTTTSYFSGQWITNSFINLKRARNVVFINDLESAFSGQTALLASSGPSLERDVDFIQNYQGVLFALPPSLPFLLKNGIRPDFVVLADSGFSSILHLRKAFSSGLCLICDLSAHPALLSRWQGVKVIMNFGIPGLDVFYRTFRVPYMPQGGTVASTVLYLVRYMGFKDLLLCGQDFAYPDWCKAHVAGSGYEAHRLARTGRWRTLPGLAFESVKTDWPERAADGLFTDRKLKMYRDYFERTRKSLGVRLAAKTGAGAGMKKKADLTGRERIPPLPGLEALSEKLEKLRMEGPVTEFLDNLSRDTDLYPLLEGLNFLLFLRARQGLESDPDRFYSVLKPGIERIRGLLEQRGES